MLPDLESIPTEFLGIPTLLEQVFEVDHFVIDHLLNLLGRADFRYDFDYIPAHVTTIRPRTTIILWRLLLLLLFKPVLADRGVFQIAITQAMRLIILSNH